MKLDASVADQYITYPTDLKLLNTARQETERLIDILYMKGDYDTKPSTYRRKARKEYLVVSKKRHKDKKELRVIIGEQVRYVRRNISTILCIRATLVICWRDTLISRDSGYMNI